MSKRLLRVQLLTLIVGLYANAEAAIPSFVSVPVHDVRYDVTVDSAGTTMEKLKVEMSFSVARSGAVIVALPVWAPGDYRLQWFARRVSEFTATEAGHALNWNKVGPQTWSVAVPKAGRVQVAFRYVGDSLQLNAQYTHTPNFATFEGIGFFLYPVGHGFDWPATVSVHAESSTRVLTALAPAGDRNTFRAANYHELVDAPFFVGQFDVDSLKAAIGWLHLGSYPLGSFSAEDRAKTLKLLSRLLPVDAAVFGEVPFDNYVVLQRSDPSGDNRGGLEHQNSQLVDLPEGKDWEGWHHFLYAHELFHAWNVKRLRPADLTPYRYDFIQPTPWLWVSEGITSYYANLSLVRAGVNDSAVFYGNIASDIQHLRHSPAFAVTDASLSEWIDPTNGASGDYYAKGEVIGFLLDVLVRDGSNNRRSLDDVMRQLYLSTYKNSSRGFTEEAWWGTMSKMAGGRPFGDFNRRYIVGRDELPVDAVLSLAGLTLTSPRQPEFSLRGERNGDCLRVTEVSTHSAAEQAGLHVGDCLARAGGVPIVSEYALREVKARYANTRLATIPLDIRRAGESMKLSLPVRLVESRELAIEVLSGASAKAQRIRNGILSGRVGD